MKKIVCMLLVIAYVLLPRPSSVHSQLAVFDAANEVHNIEQVIKAAIQIQHQVTQIAHLVHQIELMLINLEDISDVVALVRAVDFSLTQLSRTTGIPYVTPEVVQAILDLYPFFGGIYPGLGVYRPHWEALNLQTWRAAEDAMMGQAILDATGMSRDMLDLQMDISRTSVGNLSATKATNEILGLNTTELMRLSQIQAMNGRLAASQALSEAAKEDLERSRMIWIQETWAGRIVNTAPGVNLP